MSSKYIFRALLVLLTCVLITSETYAGLFDRMIYMMMKNRRRTYVPFPTSIFPFANYIGSPSAYSYPAYANLGNVGAFLPYLNYLAAFYNVGGLGPIGPWGGINPLFGYLNYADLSDLRSNFGNYLNIPHAQALNQSEGKDEKKLSYRLNGPTLGAVNGFDRKRFLVDNFFVNPKPFRPAFTFPLHDDYLNIIR